tara:strand:- start:735 stop:1367 length:633 start_codon:yes stop_codon:yes gene_type:complete
MLNTKNERQVLLASTSAEEINTSTAIFLGASMLMKHFYTFGLTLLLGVVMSSLMPDGMDAHSLALKAGAIVIFLGLSVILFRNAVHALKLRGMICQLMTREHDPVLLEALIHLARYARFAGLYVILTSLVPLVPVLLMVGVFLLLPILGLQADWTWVMMGIFALYWVLLFYSFVMLAVTVYGVIIAVKVNMLKKKFSSISKEVEGIEEVA